MMARARRPRIAPIVEADRTVEIRELLDAAEGPHNGPATNIFATLVRHPGLFRKWLPFAGKLLAGGTLPPRDRELLILRTAVLCRADYEWGQHVRIAAQFGLDQLDFERVFAGPDAAGLTPFDSTLLQAADELHTGSEIGETTWLALAQRYNERQLIELPFVVGAYHMLAFVLKSVGVESEHGVAMLPDA